ncbi:MAG: AhpC/TSA family protein [Bacteroidetes bacterium]|nr:AhpC/TSA family protein [Bacteroidota bacterium]
MMIKKYLPHLIILLVALGAVGYFVYQNRGLSDSNNEDTNREKAKSVTIKGVIKGAEGMDISLDFPAENKLENISKTKISADGSFELTGNIKELNVYQLTIPNLKKAIPLSLLPGDQITLQTNADEFAYKPNASGTEWCGTLNKFAQFTAPQPGLSPEESFQKLTTFVKSEMLAKPENPFNVVLLYYLIPSADNIKVLEEVVTAYEFNYPNTIPALRFRKTLNMVRPQFALKTLEGKEFDIATLKGKVVLVDFWASWCGPCRKENPNIVAMYKKYKSKGFEIVSISLDEDYKKWEEAIAADGLIWPNHISDLGGWNSYVIGEFGISSIPYTMLLDRNGLLLAQGLRGPELEETIKKALDEK